MFIASDEMLIVEDSIGVSKRIGVDYAEEDASLCIGSL
jgi:hypothetical protein